MTAKPKMMLFSHISSPLSITGAEKLLLFFCRELSSFFHCVLVAPEEGWLTSLARKQGIRVIIFRIPLLYSVYEPGPGLETEAARLKNTPLYRRLLRLMKAETPQLVMVNTCVHYLPAAAGKQLKIPVIWKLTELISDNGYLENSTALIDRNSDWIISISESAARGFSPEVRQSKLSVLHPSWNEEELRRDLQEELRAEFRKAWGIEHGNVLIGMVTSFLVESKGTGHFIDMALDVMEDYPEARFLIVGRMLDEEYDQQCRHKIHAAVAMDRFIFAGCHEEMAPVYSALDVVVVPSLIQEGFGLTAMEGLIHGKPVIAYASGGLQELLEIADCAHMLAEPGDFRSLSAKLRCLLEDPGQIPSLGLRSKDRLQAALGPTAYRSRLAGLVSEWRTLRPGWFNAAATRFSKLQGRGTVPVSRSGRWRKAPARSGEASSGRRRSARTRRKISMRTKNRRIGPRRMRA